MTDESGAAPFVTVRAPICVRRHVSSPLSVDRNRPSCLEDRPCMTRGEEFGVVVVVAVAGGASSVRWWWQVVVVVLRVGAGVGYRRPVVVVGAVGVVVVNGTVRGHCGVVVVVVVVVVQVVADVDGGAEAAGVGAENVVDEGTLRAVVAVVADDVVVVVAREFVVAGKCRGGMEP